MCVRGSRDEACGARERERLREGGDGGSMVAAGPSCGRGRCTSQCRSSLLILNLVMPTPRDLPISPCRTHCTVILSEQPQRESSVHWSKACCSAWRARMGRKHHLHGWSGTAKGRQRRWSGQKAGILAPGLSRSAKPTVRGPTRSDPVKLVRFTVVYIYMAHPEAEL